MKIDKLHLKKIIKMENLWNERWRMVLMKTENKLFIMIIERLRRKENIKMERKTENGLIVMKTEKN